MKISAFLVVLAVAFLSANAETVDHQDLKSLAQPVPSGILKRAAVEMKPSLHIVSGCVSFPAVDEAGVPSGGLKPTEGTHECREANNGSQVYGRAQWHGGRFAIMYCYYFPKGFQGHSPSQRHDFASAVVWLDNPHNRYPKILGVSTSMGSGEYNRTTDLPDSAVDGTRVKLAHAEAHKGPAVMYLTDVEGESFDLILWEQLPDQAQDALNDASNWDSAEVPISDDNFAKNLQSAWPF